MAKLEPRKPKPKGGVPGAAAAAPGQAAQMTTAPPPAAPQSPLGPPLLTGDIKSKIGQVSGGGLVSQANPELQNRINAAQSDLTNEYNRSIFPTISRSAEAAGRFGSDAYQTQQGLAVQGLTGALGDVSSGMRLQDYNARMADMMQALGLGTNLYGIDSQAQVARDNNSASHAAAAANMAAQQAMFDKELQFKAAQAMQQGDLSQLGMMLDASGQLGNLQQGALGQLPGIDQMGGMGFLSQMLQQSTGLDAAAINAILEQQGLGLQQQGLRLQGQGLAQDQQKINLMQQAQQYGQQSDLLGFMNQNPWDMLNAYGNLVNGMTSDYGTSESVGHQTTPYMGPDPWDAAIQGAMGGATLGMGGFGGMGRGNRAGQPPPGYNPTYNF